MKVYKVMMSLRMSLTVPLLFLIFISGVGAQYEWEVIYSPKSICALKGSTVFMGCTYSYPSSHTVKTAFWSKEMVRDVEPPDLLKEEQYKSRAQYLGNKQKDCRLSLSDVRESDQINYYFRFTTYNPNGKWQGKDGVNLSVTGLQVEVPERVMEGDKVTLTCKTTCSLTDSPSFTWYRNGAALSSRTEQLYLQSVSREDAGRYSCSVWGHNLRSPEVTLSVICLQVEGPREVKREGDKVTLTCKPTCGLTDRTSFTWYKNGAPLSSSTEKLYLQSVSRKDTGRYSCGVDQNLRSPEVTLNVLYLQVEGPDRVNEGDKVTLTCKPSFTLPSTPTFTWYRNGTTLSSRTEQLYLQSVTREDTCNYSCALLDQNLHSHEFTLNVRYLQVEGPEEVMEGDKVTLTCKPSFTLTSPTTFTWYRNKSLLSYKTEQLYLQSVSREDAGRYSCAVLDQNLQSHEVTLNVRYPPKNISVSISPSGKILEGSSLTLTCSSDGNPPVEYYWYKGKSFVTKGENFTLNNINSVNSEGYKCKSSNEHGEKYSDNVTLNVLYPPKSVSVSISPSGEIVEGSSVNLTCSSDGNPPVQNYTWFKDGGSSPVGSGNRYSAVESGSYYCVAQNKYGSQKAAAVTVTLGGVQSSVVFAAVGVSAACLLVVGVIFFVRRKRSGNSSDGADPRQDNIYSNVGEISAVSDSTPGPDPSNQDDVQYATVVPRRLKPSPAVNASSNGTDEEVQYATVQHRRDKVVKKPAGDDVEYASVRFSRSGARGRSNAPLIEDDSVIYSSLK